MKKKKSRDIQICQRECFARNNQKIKTFFFFGKRRNEEKKIYRNHENKVKMKVLSHKRYKRMNSNWQKREKNGGKKKRLWHKKMACD